jgi:hypothetical protein
MLQSVCRHGSSYDRHGSSYSPTASIISAQEVDSRSRDTSSLCK